MHYPMTSLNRAATKGFIRASLVTAGGPGTHESEIQAVCIVPVLLGSLQSATCAKC